MGAAVRIMRAEHTAADLRALAAKSRDGAQVRRLLALVQRFQGTDLLDSMPQRAAHGHEPRKHAETGDVGADS